MFRGMLVLRDVIGRALCLGARPCRRAHRCNLESKYTNVSATWEETSLWLSSILLCFHEIWGCRFNSPRGGPPIMKIYYREVSGDRLGTQLENGRAVLGAQSWGGSALRR